MYGITGSLCAIGVAAGLGRLIAGGPPPELTLPIGLPWLGMHFRLDALSAFFVVVVDLGGLLAMLFAVGYARDEPAPRRALPFVPAFLAGMNLVLVADDAFAFLLAWERCR